MRFQIRESELPRRMRQFLADIDSGAAYAAETLQKSRPALSSCLCGLIDTARQYSLPFELNSRTAEAMLSLLADAGWTQNSLSSQRTYLRHYAYETGEGVEWALASGANDRRPVELVFRTHFWTPYRSLIPMLTEQGVEDRLIRLADRWLRHRESVKCLTLDHVLAFKTDPRNLGKLAEFMTAIDPGNPDTRLLQEAQRKRRSKAKGRTKQPAYGNLPEPFLSQAKAIASVPGDRGGLSGSRVKVMGSAIRRLLRSAANHGLEPELTMDTARAFAADLLADDLKTISAAGYCDFLGYFAKHAGYPKEISDVLLETHWALKADAKEELREKEIKLARNPVGLVDFAITAHELLLRAPDENDIRNRRRDYTLAGAIALLCKLPIRAKDIRKGKIGEEFCRDSEGWSVDLKTSKTGQKIKGRLADCLTPYLDAVLLMDTDPAHLWQIYDTRLGTALFANPARDWKNYEREWLRRNMVERTGHSAHIVRSLIYDTCVLDDDLDLRVARALCGHGHETSRLFYEINADRYRRDQALDQLAAIEGRLTN
ncbi:hypothetical protein [Leisingera aquaemixtae]|uniref:Uncharacterized protein n=1 Tax=Leisingera aquaemixtae TaxID=1396826 RepID=A0A0P1H8I8_9RHOB|nr:hypothetical protein [Leisingera aquaemixtae]CUH99353.1 hypothetical protein PHA8399_01471 [Leisingera aquaemixtae]